MIMKLAESTTLRQHCSKACKDVRKGGRKEGTPKPSPTDRARYGHEPASEGVPVPMGRSIYRYINISVYIYIYMCVSLCVYT